MTFFSGVRPLFGGRLTQSQVDGLNTLLEASRDVPLQKRAYILATAHHETGGLMQPVREAFGKSDADTVNRLENAWLAGKLGQVSIPYWRFDQTGRAWFGRGLVQLTHEKNYARAGQKIGVDLIANPSLALEPEIAAKILIQGSLEGWFTGKKLSDYIPGDYVNARRVINGTDRAHSVARLARGYEAALKSFGDPVARRGLWALLGSVLKFVVQLLRRK